MSIPDSLLNIRHYHTSSGPRPAIPVFSFIAALSGLVGCPSVGSRTSSQVHPNHLPPQYLRLPTQSATRCSAGLCSTHRLAEVGTCQFLKHFVCISQLLTREPRSVLLLELQPSVSILQHGPRLTSATTLRPHDDSRRHHLRADDLICSGPYSYSLGRHPSIRP